MPSKLAPHQVERRTRNRDCCMRLVHLLKKHPRKWRESDYRTAALNLAGAAFSLWRANQSLDRETGEKMDLESKDLLGAIIDGRAHPLDARFDGFMADHHLTNARLRLLEMGNVWPEIVPSWDFKQRDLDARWSYAQVILSETIDNFATHLGRTALSN